MPITTEDFHSSLYDLLRTKGYEPIPLDSKGKTSPFYPEADIFKFSFVKDGKKYGDVWATVDNALKLVLYYDDEVASSPTGDTAGAQVGDSWPSLLRHLKRWAQRRQLGFELKNKDHLVSDMQQREFMKKKERLGEGYYPMGKKASYNDAIPQVKIVIQHSKQLGEGEQRFRNVEKIFVENTEGERFAVPTKKPGLAKIYARHVAEGGTPYDERGRHLTTLIEEYSKMVGFMRATKSGEFTEAVQRVVEAGRDHFAMLRETLHKLISNRGYHNYFESWSPVLNEEQTDTGIATLFTKQQLDPRIESCIPILSKVAKLDETKPVKELDAWADEVIRETTSIDLSKEGPTPVMPGAGKNTRTSRERDREREKALSHYSKELAADHYGKELEKSDKGVAEGSDKLQGTPVVSLGDFDDKDYTKDRYGRRVPKKLKPDDPRVKFHKEPKKQGVTEMDNRTPSGDRREQRANSPEEIAKREKEQQADLTKVSPEMRKKLRLPEPKQGVKEGSKDKVHLKTPKHGLADHPGRNTGVGLRTFASTPEQDRCSKCNTLYKNHYQKQGVAEGDVIQGPWGRKPTFKPEVDGTGTSTADQEPTGLRQVLQDKYSRFDNVTITWKSSDQLDQEVDWDEGEELPPNLIGEFEVKFEEDSDEGYTMEVTDTWSVKSKNFNGRAPYELKRTARISAEMESLDPQQKKAGQLGPTEKAKNISPVLGSPQHEHPFDGKLVGASESADLELKRLKALIDK